MFRINPLNALRLLSENVYHEIFKDASTEITTDELELAKKIKGKNSEQYSTRFSWTNQAINQWRICTIFPVVINQNCLFTFPAWIFIGIIDVLLLPSDLAKLNPRKFSLSDWYFFLEFTFFCSKAQINFHEIVWSSIDWLIGIILISSLFAWTLLCYAIFWLF